MSALSSCGMPATPVAADSRAFRELLDADNAAKKRFNDLPADLETTDAAAHQLETDRMIEASLRADAAIPTTWHELAIWVEHVSDEGNSLISELNQVRLLAHTRRLSDRGA